MKLFRENFFLILILILGAFLRLFLLGVVPLGVTHDELGYIFNAYSIALTGKNVFGQTFPFLTWMVSGGFPFMPVPIYFSAPFFWFLGLSATTGRLPSALLGIADIFLLYLLVNQIFKNKTLSLLSALFLAISPWHLHFSRTAYDTNFSAFFFLLGIVLFFYGIKQNKLTVFSLFSFLIGIYSYRGMSIIAIPLLIMLLIYGKLVLKAEKKQIIVFSAGIIFIVLCFLYTIFHYGKPYTAEGQAVFDNQKMTDQIMSDARESQGPLLIKRIFINKPAYILDKVRENYLQTFSPDFLFLHTESSSIYSIWSRGRIYFIDCIFIILGFFFLYKINKKGAILITAVLLLSALPGGIGGNPYSARNFFMSLIFPIFSAGGVLLFIYWKKQLKTFALILVAVIYTYSLGSYLFDYYGKFTFQNAESFAKSLRDISFLMLQNENKYSQIIAGPMSHGDFIQFAFYAHLSPVEVQKIWKESHMQYQGPFRYKNIIFIPGCPSVPNKSTFIITNTHCLAAFQSIGEIRDYYGNIIWKEYSY